MKIILLEIDIVSMVVYIIGALVGWAIFYYVIKAAVKNGILEANDINKVTQNSKPKELPNSAQIELQRKYDHGEISFDEYKNEWDRLN